MNNAGRRVSHIAAEKSTINVVEWLFDHYPELMTKLYDRDGVLLPIHCSVDQLTMFRAFAARGCLEELEQKDKILLWKRICEAGSDVMWEIVSKHDLDLERQALSDGALKPVEVIDHKNPDCESMFEMLDIEIQLMILRILDVKILCRLAQVNKKLNALASNAQLWRFLYLQTFSGVAAHCWKSTNIGKEVGSALLQFNWKDLYKLHDSRFFDSSCVLSWKDIKMNGTSLHTLLSKFVTKQFGLSYTSKAFTFLLPQKYCNAQPDAIILDMKKRNVLGKSEEVCVNPIPEKSTQLGFFLDEELSQGGPTLREAVANALEVPSDKVSAHAVTINEKWSNNPIFGTLFLSLYQKAAFVCWQTSRF
eukprot:TRINITY_DN6120_c0_g1_i3.p1 TRINITY_DN6120_c0_g1~~TRINITY_DN6120_c0_g1_i3.p1  ORF type:complete len:426 (-),score=61.11 TRINITY_DN6120_c0_g1_i3:3-1091(-)